MTHLLRIWSLSAALLASAGCATEDTACTLIGCESQLEVRLPAALPPGAWRFDLTANGLSRSCEATLPLGAEEPTCSASDVRPVVDQSGAVPMFRAIQLLHAPASIEVVATRDGTEVARQSFQPDYQQLFPNGRECDEVPCLQATVPLAPIP